MNAPVPQTDPLAALRGIHLPEAIGLWPLAPGWWIALGVVVAAILVAAIAIRVRRASLAYHALRELDALDCQTEDVQVLAVSISELLRRVALRRYGPERVASLHGSAWQEFLAETSPHEKRRRATFDEDMSRLLALAPYAPPGSASIVGADAAGVSGDGVVAAARDWIRWNT